MLVSGLAGGVSKAPCLNVAAEMPSSKRVVAKDTSVGIAFVAVVVCVADMFRKVDDCVLGRVALQTAGSRCERARDISQKTVFRWDWLD